MVKMAGSLVNSEIGLVALMDSEGVVIEQVRE